MAKGGDALFGEAQIESAAPALAMKDSSNLRIAEFLRELTYELDRPDDAVG
jgi:hypothetical protein